MPITLQHVIFKYPLSFNGEVACTVPSGSSCVFVEMQHGIPTLWMRRSYETEPTERRVFRVVGTGAQFDPDWIHVGSTQDAPFIWHVMEIPQ